MTRQAPKTLSSLGLLKQNPNSFNDLLTMFESYLETLEMPLIHVVHKVQEDVEIDKGEIVYRLTGHSDDASQMAEKLQALRAAHNVVTDVTVTLTAEETRRIEIATADVPFLLGHAEGIFELLHRGVSGGFLEGEPGLPGLLEICARGFKAAAANEGEAIAMFDQKLRNAMGHRAHAQLIREGAIPAQRKATGK